MATMILAHESLRGECYTDGTHFKRNPHRLVMVGGPKHGCVIDEADASKG